MSYYSPDLIQQIVEATDIVDIISQYVPLEKKGQRYMACCPFHNEKTPSFNVDPNKKLYYCFGCHEGGNIFNFLEKKANMNFLEAVKFLAERAHIDLPTEENTQQNKKAKENQEIYQINANAGNYFYKNLKHNKKALGYLVDRGISHDVIFEFGLGYSKKDWNDLKNYLESINIKKDLIEKAGLIRSSKNNTYDLFRDRLIIPIQNVFNKVVAFGGRKFKDTDPGPKYLNSPDSPVFNKKNQLFNLNRAKSEIRDKPLILVEGYMDVIALYSYGIKNVAAALGTAFTPGHIKLINQYTNSVVLCFDGDLAGEKATIKALELLENSPLKVNIIRLPNNHDPDSYIREFGVEAFNDQISKAISIPEFKINQLEKHYNLNQPNEIVDFVSECCKLIKKLSPVEQDIYIKLISKKSGIDSETVKKQLKETREEIKVEVKPKVNNSRFSRRIKKELAEAQTIYLLYCYHNPNFLNSSSIEQNQLSGRFYKWLYQKLEKLNKINPSVQEIIQNEDDKVFLDLLNEFLNYPTIQSKETVNQAIEIIKRYDREKKIKQLETDLIRDEKNKDIYFKRISNLRKANLQS